MKDVKHTAKETRAEARRICGLPKFHDRCAGIDGILRDVLDINKDLLEACRDAFRALPASADAVALRCQAAISKAEGN